MMQITYQKNDGCIIQRTRNTMLPYKIGDTTSMGWKVLNIECKYKDQYYPLYKYSILIEKEKQQQLKKKKTIELFLNEIRTFFYCLVAVIIISFARIFFGM